METFYAFPGIKNVMDVLSSMLYHIVYNKNKIIDTAGITCVDYNVPMVTFTATIKQFAEQGEKTGWTYIEIPADIAQELMPGNKKSFRVKGKLDQFAIAGMALLPMGAGNFILPLNASMRKGTHKKKGGMLKVQLAIDTKPLAAPAGFIECLEDEPKAKVFSTS
jgi:hypothetical protein